MATVTGILTNIKTRMTTVTGIGRVHSFWRWAHQDSDFNSFAVTGGIVNFWQIRRLSTRESWMTSFQYERVHDIDFFGAYSHKDATPSEPVFQGIVERVTNVFRSTAGKTLAGTVQSLVEGSQGGLQINSIQEEMIFNILCHVCRARLKVKELPSNFPT